MNFGLTDATAGYDALGRMKVYTEAATATLPSANLSWDYDANGNIRRTVSTYVTVGGNGAASAPVTSDYWFRFDAMNRVVTDRGSLVNGAIVRAPAVFGQGGGQDIQYDAAGQRVAVLRTDQTIGGYYTIQRFETRESYAYDAGGRLIGIAQSTGQASSGAASGGAYVAPAPLAGTRRSSFGYDLAGHQTQQSDYEANGSTIVYSRAATYATEGAATGKLVSESVSTKKTDNAIYRSDTNYDYGSGAGYALGNAVTVFTANTRNAVFQSSGTTTNSYVYQDGAVQSIIQHISNSGSQGYTFFTYDALGTLTAVQVNDGRSRTITFVNDIDGQIIRRDEQDASSQGDPHERWYRFGGRQLGYTGNDGTDDMTAAASIEDRKVISPSTPGAFRNGQTAGTSYADFAQSYDPLNSYAQGSQAGGYTIRGGETLPGIAQNLWGDAGLWYKLAEANGLSATSTLTAGTTLTLPAGVVKTTHNASTLTPYDPAEAIGDVSPTTPQPNKPKKNKCGVFGQILVLAVSIAVTAIASTIPVVGPIIGPAAGNLAGQAFGQVTGIQQGGINWKSVGSTFLRTLLPQGGVLTEIATQGIEQAIGLRGKFDWGGVAASGVLAALQVAGSPFGAARSVGAQVAQTIAINAAYTLADAATRSAVNGTSFGDNIRAALPGALVHTAMDIGRDAAAGRLSSGYYKKPEAGASGSGGGGGGGSTFGSGKTVGQRFEAMLPDVTSTASLRQVAYNVIPSRSPASYGAFGDTAFEMVRALLNLPDPNDIVVTARREQVTEAQHSWGWKLAEAAGLHSAIDQVDSAINYFFRPSSSAEISRAVRGSRADAPFNASQPSTVRSWVLQRRIADGVSGFINGKVGAGAAFDRYVGTPLSNGLGTALRYTVGPGTPVDTLINKRFYAVTDAIGRTPAGDPGVIMSLESNGVTAPIGAALAGIRSLNTVQKEINLLRAENLAAKALTPTIGIQANKAAGDAMRDVIALREAPALTEQSFTTIGGVRRIDVLKLGDETLAIESKVGRTSLGTRERQELARDWWLQRQGKIGGVRWEFSPSSVNGGVGPTPALQTMIEKLGFQTRINP